jgi:cyclin-dependent kinase
VGVIFFRDLKPHNILVEKSKGLLKIRDLGLERAFVVPLKSYTLEVPSCV